MKINLTDCVCLTQGGVSATAVYVQYSVGGVLSNVTSTFYGFCELLVLRHCMINGELKKELVVFIIIGLVCTHCNTLFMLKQYVK